MGMSEWTGSECDKELFTSSITRCLDPMGSKHVEIYTLVCLFLFRLLNFCLLLFRLINIFAVVCHTQLKFNIL